MTIKKKKAQKNPSEHSTQLHSEQILVWQQRGYGKMNFFSHTMSDMKTKRKEKLRAVSSLINNTTKSTHVP